jgi:D-serine deaminase-like pyridoxal phosphate-dependent protein
VRLHVWLKVDCGYHRAGVDPDDPGSLDLAARLATSPVLQFDGILTHSGHAYYAESRQIMGEIAQQERDVMLGFAQRLHDAGVQVPAISIGSTPALAAIDHLDGIDEIRPGNYAFYDWTQVALGTCTESACALTVLASVVSASPNLDQSIIDAGALALSKDALIGPDQAVNWGHVYVDPVEYTSSDELRLTALSQEHGILNRHVPLGSRVRIVPIHSCLTAACFDNYFVVDGEEVVDRWKIWRDR